MCYTDRHHRPFRGGLPPGQQGENSGAFRAVSCTNSRGGTLVNKSTKVFGLVLVLLTVVALGAFAEKGAIRLGLEFGNPTAVIIIRPGNFDFKVGYDLRQDGNLFLSADYRIVSGYQLIDFLHIFLGVGAYAQIFFGGADFELGARIPVGLQVFLLNSVLELFAEVAPTVGFLPTITAFPQWQGYVGFTVRVPRFW
jgi:hypothetical protein